MSSAVWLVQAERRGPAGPVPRTRPARAQPAGPVPSAADIVRLIPADDWASFLQQPAADRKTGATSRQNSPDRAKTDRFAPSGDAKLLRGA